MLFMKLTTSKKNPTELTIFAFLKATSVITCTAAKMAGNTDICVFYVLSPGVRRVKPGFCSTKPPS